ncbi:MAG: carboxylesterase family protein, partial [Mariniblastus sp.]
MTPLTSLTSLSNCIASATVLLLTAFAGCGVAEPTNAQAALSFAETETVQLADGPVIGRTEQGVHAFKGIPYAAPPVGNLRWKPPQAPAQWKEARKCFQFGAACPQIANQIYKNQPKELVTSEDCRFLNVWTPTLDQTKKLPVMVWIHGGGNTSGSGHQPSYEGS